MKRCMLLALLVLSALATMAATGPFIGFRADGTGVYPADCRPVTEWSETKNVAWKTPLPNAGHGSPIVVGDRAFIMCEPGWKSDCPVLVCVDARDGTLLWEREVDHFDLLPDTDRKEACGWRAEYWALWRKGMTYVYQAAQHPDQAAALQQQAAAEGIGKYGFGNIEFRTPWYKPLRTKYAWPEFTWGMLCIGTTQPTPVSDGKFVYVETGFNTVACYDLDGNRKWIKWFREPFAYHDEALFVVSPILVDGKLIIHGNRWVRAINAENGELLWQTMSSHQLYMEGMPFVLTLNGTKVVCVNSGDVLRLSDGKLLAGKIGLFAGGAGFLTDGKDVMIGYNGRSGGAYSCSPDRLFAMDLAGKLIAVRLTLTDPDTVTPTLIWSAALKLGESGPVYHDGKVICPDGTVDVATGTVTGGRGRARTDHAWVLVDGKLFGMTFDGTVTVVDAPTSRVLATNKLDMIPPVLTDEKREQIIAMCGKLKPDRWYSWNASRSLPTFSGNRIFIRTFDALYCIGKPDEPFTPSPMFTTDRD